MAVRRAAATARRGRRRSAPTHNPCADRYRHGKGASGGLPPAQRAKSHQPCATTAAVASSGGHPTPRRGRQPPPPPATSSGRPGGRVQGRHRRLGRQVRNATARHRGRRRRGHGHPRRSLPWPRARARGCPHLILVAMGFWASDGGGCSVRQPWRVHDMSGHRAHAPPLGRQPGWRNQRGPRCTGGGSPTG